MESVSPTEAVSDAPSSATPSGVPSAPPEPPEPPDSAVATLPIAWQLLGSSDAPAPRSDHTWTVSPDGTAAWLFGGTGADGPLDDLWRYDLVTDAWQRVEASGDGPLARFGHVAAWVEQVGLVIWSGQAGADFFDDLWAFDPSLGSWARLPDGGAVPAARYGSCGAIGPDGRLWISHGFSHSGRFDDTWTYDFTAGQWAEVLPDGERPIKRCLHDCLWTPDGRFLLYAGQTDGEPALADLWGLEADRATWWRLDPPEPPEARQLYALTTLGSTAFIFGGADAERRPLDSLFLLDLDDASWSDAQPDGEQPPGRSGATLIADRSRDRLLLLGGIGSDGALGDLWQLDLGR